MRVIFALHETERLQFLSFASESRTYAREFSHRMANLPHMLGEYLLSGLHQNVICSVRPSNCRGK
jgi:hypothetical protein